MSWSKGIVLGIAGTIALGVADARAAFDWKRYDGETITFLSSNHPWPNAVLPHIEEFKKLTGIDVRLETFNEAQMQQRLATLLQGKSSDIDVFMTLKAREGQLFFTSGWYKDLKPLIEDPEQTAPDYNFADFNPNLVAINEYEDQVVTIPTNIEGPVLYYRNDVFKECNLQPPSTLEGIADTAAKLKECRPDLVPFASRGLREALNYTFVPMFYNMGGNYDHVADKKNYCSEVGAKAIKYYADLLNNYGPPGVSNYTFYQVTEIMGQGRAAMSYEASNEFGKLASYPGRTDDISMELLPPGAESKLSKPLAISWGVSISNFSQKVGPAWYFLQWSTSKEMQERIAFDGIAPPRESVFNGDKFAAWIAGKPNRQQWADVLKQLAATGVGNTVPNDAIPAPEANDIISQGVQAVMSNGADPMEAGCAIDEKLATLLVK
jgi:multiple sugar transport system substrate-binding protein